MPKQKAKAKSREPRLKAKAEGRNPRKIFSL
jgi:hypothetical protein